MENESRIKRLLKKISMPLSVFMLFFAIAILILNFIANAIYTTYRSYFVEGTFFNPSEIDISSEWFTNTTLLFSNLLLLTIFGSVSLVIASLAVYKFKSNFGSLKNNQKGSSRFTTLKEIKQQYKAVPELKESYAGGGGVPVSRHKDKVFIDDSAVNNLIVGTTRSGKGETFIFPAIDIYSRAEKKPSMIFNDPKGELLSSSKETLEKLGYHIEVLNLMNPMQSMSYNLLELVKTEFLAENFSQAQQYARSLAFMLYHEPKTPDQIWSKASTNLCTALILGLCEVNKKTPEKITMYNVALMLSELSSKIVQKDNGEEEDGLVRFFKQFPPNHPARLQFATYEGAMGATKASILMNTTTPLGIFTLEGIGKLTSQNSLEMEKVGFNHWLRGKAKPLTRVHFVFGNGKKGSIQTDDKGYFTYYHDNHLEIGESLEIVTKVKKNENKTVATVKKIDEEGNIEFTQDNEIVNIVSGIQFEKPIAVFMIVPDYDETFNIIASLFVKQLYTTLARASSNVASGKCFREVVFMLDEFGNMPSIDGMANILTVCLGRNIRFNLVIQAYSQLEKLYGDDWKTIDGNTNNTFYILTDDHTTAEMISKKIGDETQVVKSRSGETLSLGKSKTESVEARPLLNPDELMRLKEGEMVVIRTIKRQDTERQRIKQFPIFNTEITSMKYRWEYLSQYFDTSKSINDIDIDCLHDELKLSELRVDFSKAVIESLEHNEDEEQVSESKTTKVNNDLANSYERKPPKSKKERLDIAAKEKEDAREEKSVSKNAINLTKSNIPSETTTGSKEDDTDLAFTVPKTKVENNLNEILFRKNLVNVTFEEIYTKEFKFLSIEEVKAILLSNQQNYENEGYYKKLVAIVDEKKEKL